MGALAPLAIFGITNDGLNLFVNILLLFLFAVYIALIWWTYADARRRVEDPMLVGCATAAAVIPFIGTVVYMIVRPPEFLEDVHERELEIAAAEARLADTTLLACPYCDFEVEKSFLRCPNCLRRLKEPCTTCGKPLDPLWKLCPYCESEISAAPTRRPRRSAEDEAAAPAAAVAEAPARSPRSSSGERATRERPPAREGSEGAAARGTSERPARSDSDREPRASAERSSGDRSTRSGSERPPRSSNSERPSRSGDTASRRPARSTEGRSSGSSGSGSGSKKPRPRPSTRPPSP